MKTGGTGPGDFPERAEAILRREAELTGRLSRPGNSSAETAELMRELAWLSEVSGAIRKCRGMAAELEAAQTLLDGDDPDLRGLAAEEVRILGAGLAEQEEALRRLLLPVDSGDARNVILEVRAGTGGEEAALFAMELFRMYQRYAQMAGWRVEVMTLAESELGGCREGVMLVSGKGCYGRLKHESGVHRVQRVPRTESGGRLHTSAATVAVLPEIGEKEIRVDPGELRIDVFRASGPGGQSVNTTDSAVRITHLPTGITVSQQDEKSQHRNRARAMKILLARLADHERLRVERSRAEERRGQVGSGDRSERVRTYHFPQGRVTDHRIGLTLHRLERVLSGEDLGEILDALVRKEEMDRLLEDGGPAAGRPGKDGETGAADR